MHGTTDPKFLQVFHNKMLNLFGFISGEAIGNAFQSLCKLLKMHSDKPTNAGDVALAVAFNPLNAELNPICHLLALVRAHPIFHVNRIRDNVAICKRVLITTL
jgi:hypothetical protein